MNGIELLLLFSHQVIKTYQTKKTPVMASSVMNQLV
jgi:hypothetical protein